MSNFDDIMDLLGPSVPSYSGPGLEEISRPLPPAVQDTTGDADVWLPTSVAAHYKEYDRSGTAVDDLEALIARDGLLTPIRISTDGRVAVVHEGNHRLQVAQRLGISEVPAIVTFDDPVVSNGGRVTPLEPVLGSWVEQNRGRLRSFWGHRTASDYFMNHRPAGPSNGSPMHDVSYHFPDIETLPRNVYDDMQPGGQDSIQQIIDAQGNPNKPVTIYRGVPKGVDPIIRNGDWVTISREYAVEHGYYFDEPDVLSATVQAKDIWTSGDSVNEWGYWGPELRTARTYTASAGKLYRGVRIDLGIDLSLAQPGTSIETVGQELQLGPQVLDALSRQGGLGTHWSTRPEIAERFALESSGNGGGTPVLITVDWNGSGEDVDRTNTGGTWADEAEVTLLPGTPITVTSVKLGSSFRDGVEVLHSDRYLGYASDFAAAGLPVPQGGPQQRTASPFPYHDTYTQPFLPGHDWPIYLYRGMALTLPPGLENELDIAIMEADQGMIYQVGDSILDMIGNIGRHWTTEPDVAVDFAQMNRSAGNLIIVISAVWERKGEDFAEEHVGWDGVSRPSNLADEFEVTLTPGTQVRLLSVKARRVLDGQTIERDWDIELLRSPQMRTAEWQPWHSDDQEEAQEIAPGTTIYRGMKVDFSDSDFDQIWRWQQPPLVEEERGQHFKIGPFILDRLEPLGIHWTTKKRIAEIGASQGGYGGAGVIIEAEYTGTGQDLRGTAYHNDGWSVEEEITMLPGAQVRITGVFLTGIEKNKNLLRGPELRSAKALNGGAMTYYHLADEVDFRLDPDFRPQNNTTMGGDYRPGIFVSGDPYGVSHWCQMYGYWRPWVVELDGSVSGVEGGYGNEVFIPAEHFDKLRVSRVVPLDAFCRELYQDWGWTEGHYETTFDTEEPIAPHPGGWGRLETPEWKGSYRYPGDARRASSSWRSQYESRIRRYQGEVGGIVSNRRTDQRTAASDLRVHLFDSEGHEMFLEPDFDGNPWTYHPKVMDAVRYLADVAQEDGVYWHMDHNEFIPSTITDFKVFDGPNDVTHEIKEFPQLRGYYASRTAYVSDDIYESYYDTDRLVYLVMNVHVWGTDQPLWELVTDSYEEAQAFFDSLDEDERRWNAAEVLENGGWTMSAIGRKFSNRTAASTPSAPGILYRGLAVPFSEAQLEDVMEAYGKDSFVGRVLGYLSRGFFTPSREWGLGKHWTTNINVAKSFSQNGFGTPVVLVAEWDGSGEDPYNAPGNNFGGEDEVTLLPGTELRLLDVLWGPTFESIGGSGRTIIAAEPGGVLPWTPSHRGYYWITHTDGTLEAVTNDAVNRMFLTEEPWGWEWEVFDSLGFVEGGTFGMALKGGDALRDRANDLLAEFDTRAERRTRGPSRGYQDDYTQAPNTLWSKRATTSQRYAERLRREGRR